MPPYFPHLTNTTAAATHYVLTQGHMWTSVNAFLGDIDRHWLGWVSIHSRITSLTCAVDRHINGLWAGEIVIFVTQSALQLFEWFIPDSNFHLLVAHELCIWPPHR